MSCRLMLSQSEMFSSGGGRGARFVYLCLISLTLANSVGAQAEVQLRLDHPATQLDGFQILSFAGHLLRLRVAGAVAGCILVKSDEPLSVVSAKNAEARLEPGWDGTAGYSHYRLLVRTHSAGEATVQLQASPPPPGPIPTSAAEIGEFLRALRERGSRFPDDPARFHAWQRAERVHLATQLMAGGLPQRVPMDARVLDEKEYAKFSLQRVQYHTQADRESVLLLSLPHGAAKAPLLLALHGHEAGWGEADAKAYDEGHADDFVAYFAERGWAVLQPATMNHTLQHAGWTLQGEWTWDALVALDYAATVPAVDMERVAVCGLSTGGHLAMNVLALDDRVKAGVVGCVLSTWNHYRRRFRIPPHCDCGISVQLGTCLEQCDWAALAVPKRVLFQHGRQDAAFCPDADESRLDLKWNTGILPRSEYDAMFSEVQRAYRLGNNEHGVETKFHDGPHKIDNASAFQWLAHAFATVGLSGDLTPSSSTTAAADQFENQVRPLLIERCHKCHAGTTAKGGLRLDSREALLSGGESGPAVVVGKPEESLLIQAVRHENGLKMPPDGKLNEARIAALTAWIQAGAIWPGAVAKVKEAERPEQVQTAALAEFTAEEKGYWAYQPVQDALPPPVREPGWVRTPVDRFILRELEQRQLRPAPPADALKLLRRVTFDLTGLPPTPAEVGAFLADSSPQAYEAVVNRLLDSPHYGERWGRHWLDLVRYAETTANDANAVMRYAWRYRNYVIDALSSDLPYDQFLVEQLAGDLLPPTDSLTVRARRVIATGYLMIGPKALAETDKEQSRLDIVDDQIDVTGRAMLGLTVACARCHDHKFDAIRTADYYALAGIFRSTEPFQDENRNATMWWEFEVPQGEGHEPLMVMAPKESQPRNLRVHLRGNRFTLGRIVPRGVLQVMRTAAGHREPEMANPIDPNQRDSGRLQLARWIASPSNPLAARVMVNRIWQHHFGRGLVATSDNFGVRGERPSHPQLLDWLATRFVESGWSVKAMHRLIVLSNTYQQGSGSTEAARLADPDLKWCSSFTRRRFSAEELRDAMLAVSGRLDRSPGTNESGELLFEKAENINAKIRPNRLAAEDPFYSQFTKRTVYLPVVRNMLPDVLALFDAADPNSVTAVRNDTTVASQSLFLLNSPFVREQSRWFAERLLAQQNLADDERVTQAHALAYGRPATTAEMTEAHSFLEKYLAAEAARVLPEAERRLAAWQSYCQTLLLSNEFLYVE